jgi:PAS domain S-box-containing protein
MSLGRLKMQANDPMFEVLFQENPHAMWILDAETFSFLAANHSAKLRYGYSDEEFEKLNVSDVFSVEDSEATIQKLKAAPKEPLEFAVTQHYTKTGKAFSVQITTQRASFKDRPALLVTIKEVPLYLSLPQARLRLSKVSHDLKNPLNAILTYSELLSKNSEDQERRRKHLEGIRRSARRMSTLLDELTPDADLDSLV